MYAFFLNVLLVDLQDGNISRKRPNPTRKWTICFNPPHQRIPCMHYSQIFAQYIFSRNSRRLLGARKFDVSEN